MPKGNPDPSPNTRFTTDRAESLTKQLQIRVTQSMWDSLQTQDDWREFVRQAIAEKLGK